MVPDGGLNAGPVAQPPSAIPITNDEAISTVRAFWSIRFILVDVFNTSQASWQPDVSH
jgi:hypothetical protein